MGKKRIIQKSQEELLSEREKVEKKLKKEITIKAPTKIHRGRICIYSTYNNTIITLTDAQGNVLASRSAGSIGFKGTKKGTSFAASQVATNLSNIAKKFNIKEVDIIVKGIGGGRDTALKTLASQGFEIQSIKDATPVPHNGCRPKKLRRV